MSGYRLESLGGSNVLAVWTLKEGLLSRVAHDLCLHASEAKVSLTGDQLEVEVPIAALSVQGQVLGGGEVKALKAKDHAEIEKNLRSPKVLDAGRFPTARFTGTCRLEGQQAHCSGQLELKGSSESLSFVATWDGVEGRTTGEVTIRQTRWGITPFKALMGAIKLQDPLRVSWDLRLTPQA